MLTLPTSTCYPLTCLCLSYIYPLSSLLQSSHAGQTCWLNITFQPPTAFGDFTYLLSLQWLSPWSTALWKWFPRNDLQLHVNKSEVVILSISTQLWSAAADTSVNVADCSLPVSSSQLNSLSDDHLHFYSRVRQVVRSYICHIRVLCHMLTTYTEAIACCKLSLHVCPPVSGSFFHYYSLLLVDKMQPVHYAH